MNGPTEYDSAGRKKLKVLESRERYVFHGSGNPGLKSLEPRQAYNFISGGQEPDGEPAVFASSIADYALVMALINSVNCPSGYHSSVGTRSNRKGETLLSVGISKKALEQLDDTSIGYVYVFNKSDFTQREEGGVEFKSIVSVLPVDIITVKKSDLPTSIEIIE